MSRLEGDVLKRLVRMRGEYRRRLEARQRGDGENSGGIRAIHFPTHHEGAALDARGDASLALDIMALTTCIAQIDPLYDERRPE